MVDVLGIIFSCDRAMQLDAMLRSLFLHCEDVDKANLWVLYKTTNERHEKQYQELIREFTGRVSFQRQQNFRQDLLSYFDLYKKGNDSKHNIFLWLCALGKFGPPLGSPLDRVWRRVVSRWVILLSTVLTATTSHDRFVLFLVDDNIFVQKFCLEEAFDLLKRPEKLLGFSLRLGKNTKYSYSKKQEQFLPKFETLTEDIVCFDWTKSDGDFGYPLEVSSSIYRLGDILPLLMGFPFNNPNVLEERMAYHSRFLENKRSLLACYQKSVTFCNPVNMVQTVVPNRAGENIRYTADELSVRFERGERIQVETYNGFVPDACHQEVKFTFSKTRS